jgi:ribosomal protein L24
MQKIKKGDKVYVIAGKFKGAIFDVEKVDGDKIY